MRLLKPEFVMDCSITMAWCFEDECSPYTEKIFSVLADIDAAVPDIWPLEVTNVLLGAEKNKRVSSHQANIFKSSLQRLPIQICERTPPHAWDGIFELAKETKLTSYDACYLDLAIQLRLPLATLDKALKKAAQLKHVVLYLP